MNYTQNILILIIINITLVLKHTSGQPDFGHQTGFSSGVGFIDPDSGPAIQTSAQSTIISIT